MAFKVTVNLWERKYLAFKKKKERKKYFFIYFWLHWVLVLASGIFIIVVCGLLSS